MERVKHDLTLHSIIHEKDVLAVDINMEYILDVSIYENQVYIVRGVKFTTACITLEPQNKFNKKYLLCL